MEIKIKNRCKGGSRVRTQEHDATTTRTNAKKRAQQQSDRVTTYKIRSNLSQTFQRHGHRSQSCIVLKVCLVYCSKRLVVPFYSPKRPRSRWSFIWKLLAFPVYVCTWLSGGTLNNAHYNVPKITDWPLSFSDGHRTVRWEAPDCPLCHLTIGASDVSDSRSLSSTPDSPALCQDHPMNYRRGGSWTRERPLQPYSHRTVRHISDCPVGGTGLSGAAQTSPSSPFCAKFLWLLLARL
jgi:hypothetical protein